MSERSVTSPLTTPYSAIYSGTKNDSWRRLLGPRVASNYHVTKLRRYRLASNDVTKSYERA